MDLLVSLEQQLLYDLTIAERIIQTLHWNMVGENFVSVHPYFGDIYEDIQDWIDITAEEIKIKGEMPVTSLEAALIYSPLRVNDSMSFEVSNCIDEAIETFEVLTRDIQFLNNEADKSQSWGAVDTFNSMHAEMNKIVYFLNHTAGSQKMTGTFKSKNYVSKKKQ